MDFYDIKEMLIADLYCLKVKSETDLMIFCDNNCDGCKWNYQKGNIGQQKEKTIKLINLVDDKLIERSLDE